EAMQMLDVERPYLLRTKAGAGLLRSATVVVEELVQTGRPEGLAEHDFARARCVRSEHHRGARVPAAAERAAAKPRANARRRAIRVEAHAGRNPQPGQDVVEHAVRRADVDAPPLLEVLLHVVDDHLIGDTVKLANSANRHGDRIGCCNAQALLGGEPISIEGVPLDATVAGSARERSAIHVDIARDARQAADARPDLGLEAGLDVAARVALAILRIGNQGLEVAVWHQLLLRGGS